MTRNTTLRFLSFLILLFLDIFHLTASDFSFKQRDLRHGLSSDNITDFYQDQEGIVWIGTNNGLNTYTGNRFQAFKTDLNNYEHITAITASPNGDLWIGTQDNGISIYNRLSNKKQKIRTQESKLWSNTIKDVYCDTNGRIWISTDAGLNMYHTQQDSMYVFDLNAKANRLNNDLFTIFEDSKGRIYIGTWWHSIFYYDDNDQDFHQILINNKRVIQKAWSFCEDQAGNIWVGTWGDGLHKLQIEGTNASLLEHLSVTNEYFDKEIIFNIVYDITIDKTNRIWIGTDVGLGKIENPTQNKVKIEWIPLEYGDEGYLLKDITDVFFDAEESLWIGTVEYGLCMAEPDGVPFKTYLIKTGKQGPSTNTFTAFWEVNNQLYVGVQSLGFGAYDITNQHFTSYKKIPQFQNFKNLSNQLNAIVQAEQEDERYIWLLTRYQGLVRYDTYQQSLYTIPLAGMEREHMSFILDDGKVWICDRNTLVLMVKNNGDQHTPYLFKQFQASDMPRRNLSGLYKDAQGHIWISSYDGGVMKATVHSNDSLNYSFALMNVEGSEAFNKAKIQVIFEDKNQNMWFGTKGEGLWYYAHSRQSIYNYNAETTYKDMSIFAIQEDNFGHIWASTNQGLFYIVPSSGQVIKYHMDDGLQGHVFVKNSSYKDQHGRLYFGGSHGFNIVDPHLITYNTYIPPLAFTSIYIDNEPVNVNYNQGEALTLNHSHKSFTIAYTALSYKSSENNHYAYQLEGYDEEWINVDNHMHQVVYGKLNPGQYTFKLKGSNANGVWNNVPLKLKVTVKRAPYKTVWAYLVYLVLLSAIAYTIFYFWNKDNKLKRAIEEEHNERLRADKINQFKLRFFTNISHELLTPLSIISNATEQINSTQTYNPESFNIITRNTNRLLHLINQLLDFRKTEMGVKKLKVYHTDIDNIISEMHENLASLCEKKQIHLSVQGYVGKHVWIDPDFLDKILHNVLSNAFKYTPSQGDIKLFYNLDEEGILHLKIQDSGYGIQEEKIDKIFKRFYRSEDHKKAAGAGIGLAFTRSLVQLHKGKIWAQNNDDIGSTFFIELPVYREAFEENEISNDILEFQSIGFVEEIDIQTQTYGVQQLLSEKHQYKVLLVEDNKDMRSILKTYLEHHFSVFVAENGVKALDIIEKQDVDVIISDVMMPEMDGISLCKNIKTNIKTSHIPVILMTAKRTHQDMIEGYEAQADSYLSKPISMEMLLVRINNIMNQRNLLKSASSDVDEKIIEESGISNLDKTFLEKVNAIIKENISNPEFRTSDLYKSMNSSESVVFRKVKALTGKSPNQYIREIKLNVAAKMLQKGGKPLEVCFHAGFTDPSYFSACFKKQFGVTPSKYLKS